jgi:hypothetical protein
MINAALITIALSTVIGQTEDASAEYELFREFGEHTVGTWDGEFKMQFSMPGLVEKGDVIKFRTVTKWIFDKKATESETRIEVNGNVVGSGKGMACWDRSTKEIVGMSVGSLGGRTQSVFRKDGDRWIETRTAVGVDGKKSATTAAMTYSEDGNTATAVFPGGFSPTGEILPPLTIKLKRVQPQSHNENLKPLMPLIGKWMGDFTLDQDMGELAKAGDTVPVMGIYDWSKNGQAITLSAAMKVGGKWVQVTDGLIVFDALQNKITGVDCYANGGVYRYEVEVAEGKITLRGHGSSGDGEPTQTTVVCSDFQGDSFTGQFIDQKIGEKRLPDGTAYTLTRVED